MEVACAIFYIYQTGGACAGMCMCICMHQVENGLNQMAWPPTIEA